MKRFQRHWMPKQTEWEEKTQAGARHYSYIFSLLDLAFKLAATCHPQKHESPRTSRHENPVIWTAAIWMYESISTQKLWIISPKCACVSYFNFTKMRLALHILIHTSNIKGKLNKFKYISDNWKSLLFQLDYDATFMCQSLCNTFQHRCRRDRSRHLSLRHIFSWW